MVKHLTTEQYIDICEKDNESFALIAISEEKLQEYIKLLKRLSYGEIKSAEEAKKVIEKNGKMFAIVDENEYKLLYTLAKDFSSGAMQFFGLNNINKVEWLHPHKESAFCLILKKNDIKLFDNHGYNFNNVCASAHGL